MKLEATTSDASLLLVRADDHTPLLEQADTTGVEIDEPEARQPQYLWDEGGDPNDLFGQRWGIIAPEGPRGDRLLGLVEPLVRHRQQQQRGEPIAVFRVPATMTRSEAAAWKKTVFRPQTDLDVELPRYQLLLGDLDEVPLAVQQLQATDGYVGRLAFPRDEQLEAYVDKVLRWETRPAPERQGRAIFHTVHDRTSATRLGYEGLVRPCLAVAGQRLERGQLNADALVQSGHDRVPDPDELLRIAALDRPGVLLSLSHGEGPPRRGWPSSDHQRQCQGAMSFGRQGQLRGEDLVGRSFMPGGVWFMMACFGAGSPEASVYHPWLAELQAQGRFGGDLGAVLDGIPRERPFIARLPQQALASPDGPLGFVGHVDLAWTYSFRALDGGPSRRPAKFLGVLRSLLERNRLGVAFRELYRYLEQTDTELAALEADAKAGRLASDPALHTQRAHLWMLREDLAAYVLLGDPAARLPLADGATPSQIPASAAGPALRSAPPAALPLGIDELEEAIGAVMMGDDSLKTIATRHGLDRAELRRLAALYCAGGRAALGCTDD